MTGDTMTKSRLRGHEIERINGTWVFSDTKEPTALTWKGRPCGYCGLRNTPEDHDGCLGTLPDVVNACCGHGETKEAYIQFGDGRIIRGNDARRFIDVIKE